MSRKKHFWEGMSKLTICIYLLLSFIFGSMVYGYATSIFAMMKDRKFPESVLFIMIIMSVTGFILVIFLSWVTSKDIEKKQEQGKEIRF